MSVCILSCIILSCWPNVLAWLLTHGVHCVMLCVVHLVIFVVKGKRGEEGPRGKQGGPVSQLYSVISVTATVYIVPVFIYAIKSICVKFLSQNITFFLRSVLTSCRTVFQGEIGMLGPRGYRGSPVRWLQSFIILNSPIYFSIKHKQIQEIFHKCSVWFLLNVNPFVMVSFPSSASIYLSLDTVWVDHIDWPLYPASNWLFVTTATLLYTSVQMTLSSMSVHLGKHQQA